MKTLGQFTSLVIVVILSLLSSLLLTKIILSVADLYKIGFITQFSFVQIYGISLIIGFLVNSHKNPKKDSDKDESFTNLIIKSLTALLGVVFAYLIGWGFAFLMYHIIS